MGTNEGNRVVKPSQLIGDREVSVNANSLEPLVSTQNVPIAPSRSDWSAHAQAFYPYGGATPHHFFTSTASVSPSFYPTYMLGNQHQIMQLCGTSVQYSAQYTPNQLPAYPNGSVFAVPEKEENRNEKDSGSMRKCKRSSENESLTGNRLGESGKRTLPSRNDGDGDGALQSAAVGTEDLSDESNTGRNFSAANKQRSNQRLVDGAVAAQTDATLQYHNVNADLGLQDSTVNMVQTSWNTGMALNLSTTKTILTKEEHDQRKERRKQSNRESAKRSRYRRQEECKELQAKAENLAKEISTLKAGLLRVSEECGKLTEENKSIMNELEEMYGPDAVRDLKAAGPGSDNGESNSNEQRISSGNETPDENEDTQSFG